MRRNGPRRSLGENTQCNQNCNSKSVVRKFYDNYLYYLTPLKFKYFSTVFISEVGVKSIISLGICTQRCTFLTWNSTTGKALHNLITWKDVRADTLVNQWNNSLTMKVNTSNVLKYK